jgi:hypothetical protein
VDIFNSFGLFGIIPNNQRLAGASSKVNIEAVDVANRVRRGHGAMAGGVGLRLADARRKFRKPSLNSISAIPRLARMDLRAGRVSRCLQGRGDGE